MVQFAANLDDSGFVQDKVGELTIISATPDHLPGVFSGEGAPRPIRRPAKAAGTAKGKPAAADGPTGFGKSAKAKIVGKVTSFKDGHLTVQTGKRKVEVDLTEEPLIHVNLTEGTYASAGDKVVVHGKEAKGQGICEAQHVEITFSTVDQPEEKFAKARRIASLPPRGQRHVRQRGRRRCGETDASEKDAPSKDPTSGNAGPKSK